MSEKQFKLSSETVLQYKIMNNDTDLNESEVVDLLNEQQTTTSALKEENEQLQKVCSHLKKENKSLIENIFDIYEKVKWVSK